MAGKLRASSSKRKKIIENNTPNIPHDIIVIILSQVPVKDLLRYKTVSKQWKATISDPKFADNHFKLYKNSSSRNLLTWYDSYHLTNYGFHVTKFQNNRFKYLSKIKHPRKNHLPQYCDLICNCDGLYLIRLLITLGKTYMLCNPSCGVHKEIRCPQKIDDIDSKRTLYGIYYNPLMMDYKIVIADMKHYAVYSCRYNKWSEVKEMKDIFCSGKVSFIHGVSFNGSLYWLETKISVGHLRKLEIICFDGEDEKFKKLAGPDCRADWFNLTSSRGHLCLCYNNSYNEMVIMKTVKVDEKDSWKEFKVQLQSSSRRNYVKKPRPICWVSEDEVILGDVDGLHLYYMIYDLSKSSVVIQKNPSGVISSHPLPYLENLILQ